MAVELPSDLVMDVMRSADPVRRNAATVKLQAGSGGEHVTFSELVNGTANQSGVFSDHSLTALGCLAGCREDRVHKDFERMVLRNLFEALLPKEETNAFGSGPSAGVWRSMAADQLAGIYAEKGGFRIAPVLASADGKTSMRSERQWPYFSLDAIGKFGG